LCGIVDVLYSLRKLNMVYILLIVIILWSREWFMNGVTSSATQVIYYAYRYY